MTDIAALDRLIEAVEAGEGLDERWAIKATGRGDAVWKAFHGSLDAAKALHEALLPGWVWGRTEGNIYVKDESRARWNVFWGGPNDNPARAWLLAILRAHRAQIGGQ